MMKKKKQFFRGVIIGTALIVLLAASLTTSYLTDREIAYNIVTIGNVEVTIDETPFDPTSSYPADAGTVIGKAPKLKNTGKNNEYVFITVSVPKKEVTLLNETTGKKLYNDNTAKKQLFKILTQSSTFSQITTNDENDVYFHYNGYKSDDKGWYLVESVTSGEYDDVYTFGYNKKLKPKEESITLFDKVQLKSFIDTEATGESDIKVKAYAIQSDDLKIAGVTDDKTEPFLTQNQIEEIYKIVKNRSTG